MQDEISLYLLMKGETVNFAWVVIDWIFEKVKNFNLSTFALKGRQIEENMPYGSALTKIFKHFKVKLNGFDSK